MKKSAKLLVLPLIMVLLSGCVKFDVDMTINNDKSMDLVMISAFTEQLKNFASEDSLNMDSNKAEAEQHGYEISDYNEGGYTGFKMKKHINNIDELSTNEDVEADLSSSYNNEKLFKVTKGFFKDTYSAKFISSNAEQINDQVKDYQDNEAYKEYLNGLESTFTLTLPTKAKSSNATSSKENTLEWDMLKSQTIEFEFEIYNTKNIIIVCVAAVAIIAILVFILLALKKRK